MIGRRSRRIERRARVADGALLGALVLLGVLLLALAATPARVGAASPDASGAVSASAPASGQPVATEPPSGDTRSSGEGAGFVGQPLVAIGLVVVVGLAAAGATFAYVRLTAGQRR